MSWTYVWHKFLSLYRFLKLIISVHVHIMSLFSTYSLMCTLRIKICFRMCIFKRHKQRRYLKIIIPVQNLFMFHHFISLEYCWMYAKHPALVFVCLLLHKWSFCVLWKVFTHFKIQRLIIIKNSRYAIIHSIGIQHMVACGMLLDVAFWLKIRSISESNCHLWGEMDPI